MKDSPIPILVTGVHRTGTSWVGKMLAASGEAGYINEPLNVLHRPGVMRLPIERWYTYICRDNESDYLEAYMELMRFHYHTGAEIRALHSRKDIGRMGRDWLTFLRSRLQNKRPLIKDPFALFSIPWFIKRLGCQVVVILRHPAAFASSLKRLNWCFQIEDLLAQPLLTRDWLSPFQDEMLAITESHHVEAASDDIISRASLLWRMAYHCVNLIRQEFPQLIIVRHEDLSLNPLKGFRTLYEDFGMDFNSAVEKAILRSSSSDNPKEVSKNRIFTTRLDSRANLENWKRRLTSQEIIRVRHLTETIAELYYPDINWD